MTSDFNREEELKIQEEKRAEKNMIVNESIPSFGQKEDLPREMTEELKRKLI